MIELGFVSPLRTTVIASTHRLYSIHEKIATGRAIYPQADLQRAAEAAAQRLVAFDALTLAREHGTETNAILLGALAASGALPDPRRRLPRGDRAQGCRGEVESRRLRARARAGPRRGGRRPVERVRRDADAAAGSTLVAAAASLPAELRPLVEVLPLAVRDLASTA